MSLQECETYQVKDISRAVLHSILFNRCLVQSIPMEVDLKFIDVTYVKCDNASIESDVEHAANQIQSLFDSATPTSQTIDLVYYEKKEKKSWFFKAPHDNPWERWRLKLKPHHRFMTESDEDHQQFLVYLERQLKASLVYIAQEALKCAELLPPLTASPKPFAYRIQVSNSAPDSIVGLLRRMVTDTGAAPPLLG